MRLIFNDSLDLMMVDIMYNVRTDIFNEYEKKIKNSMEFFWAEK